MTRKANASLILVLALVIGLGAISPVYCAGTSRRGPLPTWSLELAGEAGLDRLARGLEASGSLGLGFSTWALSLRGAFSYDLGLSSLRAFLGLVLELGPGMAFEAGSEFALSPATYIEAVSGLGFGLESQGFPSRLALRTVLAELGPLGRGSLRLLGRIEWSSYKVSSEPLARGSRAALARLCAEEGIGAGFRASLCLAWNPRPRP